MNQFFVTLIVLTLIHGCSTKQDKIIDQSQEIITQGELAGLKIGQSKREVLKILALLGIKEIYRVNEINSNYKTSVRIHRSNIDKIDKLNDKKGICLSGYERWSLKTEFNNSNILIFFRSSPEFEATKHKIKVGQSKSEVLRSLRKLISENEFLTVKDCFSAFKINPQKLTEEEFFFLSQYDLWKYDPPEIPVSFEEYLKKIFDEGIENLTSLTYPQIDLYFSDDFLKKIVRHRRIEKEGLLIN